MYRMLPYIASMVASASYMVLYEERWLAVYVGGGGGV